MTSAVPTSHPPVINAPGGSSGNPVINAPPRSPHSSMSPVASPQQNVSPGSPRHQSGTIDAETYIRNHGGDLRRTIDSVVNDRNQLVSLKGPCLLGGLHQGKSRVSDSVTARTKHATVAIDREAESTMCSSRGGQRPVTTRPGTSKPAIDPGRLGACSWRSAWRLSQRQCHDTHVGRGTAAKQL